MELWKETSYELRNIRIKILSQFLQCKSIEYSVIYTDYYCTYCYSATATTSTVVVVISKCTTTTRNTSTTKY